MPVNFPVPDIFFIKTVNNNVRKDYIIFILTVDLEELFRNGSNSTVTKTYFSK